MSHSHRALVGFFNAKDTFTACDACSIQQICSQHRLVNIYTFDHHIFNFHLLETPRFINTLDMRKKKQASHACSLGTIEFYPLIPIEPNSAGVCISNIGCARCERQFRSTPFITSAKVYSAVPITPYAGWDSYGPSLSTSH